MTHMPSFIAVSVFAQGHNEKGSQSALLRFIFGRKRLARILSGIRQIGRFFAASFNISPSNPVIDIIWPDCCIHSNSTLKIRT